MDTTNTLIKPHAAPRYEPIRPNQAKSGQGMGVLHS